MTRRTVEFEKKIEEIAKNNQKDFEIIKNLVREMEKGEKKRD